MKYTDLLEGLKDGSITILDEGHKTRNVTEKIERLIIHWDKQILKYKENIKNNVPEKEGVTHARMLEMYESNFNCHLKLGHYIEGEVQCHNCESNMYIILLDEKSICFVDSLEYWDIVDKSGKKYEFDFTKEHLTKCKCSELMKEKKLVSKIEVPTGSLVFQNYFNTEHLYEDPENKYSSPGVNTILGRDKLMQYLATQNVGYGQMGNTSVIIYSNKKDEIIIAHCWIDELFHDNERYFRKNPDKMTEEDKKDIEEGKALLEYLKKGKFKKLGEISLSVWRWMCADKSVLDKNNEEINKKSVIAKVNPGTWEIEHYYDFPENGKYLCSKLKKFN